MRTVAKSVGRSLPTIELDNLGSWLGVILASFLGIKGILVILALALSL